MINCFWNGYSLAYCQIYKDQTFDSALLRKHAFSSLTRNVSKKFSWDQSLFGNIQLKPSLPWSSHHKISLFSNNTHLQTSSNVSQLYLNFRCCALREETNNKTACSKVVFIYDTRMLGRVLIMFLPVPMFWALYDQQGSVWLIQGSSWIRSDLGLEKMLGKSTNIRSLHLGIQMDCRLSDNVLFLPDQVQTLNAVLILVFIPVFQVIIYPLFGMCFKITWVYRK